MNCHVEVENDKVKGIRVKCGWKVKGLRPKENLLWAPMFDNTIVLLLTPA